MGLYDTCRGTNIVGAFALLIALVISETIVFVILLDFEGVVVVGDVGLNLQRNPMYKKEIDFLISCSYL